MNQCIFMEHSSQKQNLGSTAVLKMWRIFVVMEEVSVELLSLVFLFSNNRKQSVIDVKYSDVYNPNL